MLLFGQRLISTAPFCCSVLLYLHKNHGGVALAQHSLASSSKKIDGLFYLDDETFERTTQSVTGRTTGDWFLIFFQSTNKVETEGPPKSGEEKTSSFSSTRTTTSHDYYASDKVIDLFKDFAKHERPSLLENVSVAPSVGIIDVNRCPLLRERFQLTHSRLPYVILMKANSGNIHELYSGKQIKAAASEKEQEGSSSEFVLERFFTPEAGQTQIKRTDENTTTDESSDMTSSSKSLGQFWLKNEFDYLDSAAQPVPPELSFIQWLVVQFVLTNSSLRDLWSSYKLHDWTGTIDAEL